MDLRADLMGVDDDDDDDVVMCVAKDNGGGVGVVPLHDSEREDREKFSKARRMELAERRWSREKLERAKDLRSL